MLQDRGHEFSMQVSAALDSWSWFRQTRPPLEDRDAERLTRIASICDPDPVRMKIRKLSAAGDAEGLSAMAEDPEIREQPVRTIVNLATWLHGNELYAAAIELLEDATRRDPGDVNTHDLLARSLSREELDEEALRHYTALVALRPDSSLAHHNLGSVLYNLHRLEEALFHARRAVDLNQRHARTHYLLGSALGRLGRHEEAIESIRESLRLRPDAPRALAHLVNILQEQRRHTEAEQIARRIIRVAPENPDGYACLGCALNSQGRRDEALPVLRKALRLDPDLVAARTNLVNSLLTKGRSHEALEEACEAVRLDPARAVAHHVLARTLQSLGRWEKALESFRTAVRLNPRSSPTQNNLGTVLYQLGHTEEALSAWEKAASLDPSDPHPHGNFGRTYLGMGRFEEALEHYLTVQKLRENRPEIRDVSDRIQQCRDLIALEPRIPALLAGTAAPRDVRDAKLAGLFCYWRRNFAGAARLYGWAIEAEPESTVDDPRYAIFSAVLAGTGEGQDAATFDEAERARWRQQALIWIRTDLEWRLTKGEYRHLGGWLEGWLRAEELATVREPDKLSALPREELEAWTGFWAEVRKTAAAQNRKLGLALRKEGRHEQAEQAFRKAVGHDPEDLQARLGLALAVQAGQRWAEAADQYREFISRKPEYAEAHCNLGHCLVRIGEFAEAVESVRRGHELGSTRSNWRYPSAQWLASYQTYADLVPRLEAVLAGEDQPTNNEERTRFAFVLSRKGHYLKAARLYEDMFEKDEALETAGSGYNAACYAACAGTGRGVDSADLDDEARRTLRREALGWMRKNLISYREKAEAKTRASWFTYWRRDPELACVRTYPELAKLPADERKEWLVFWDDVRIALAEAKEGR
jgi:tetratricopeptide (TPR) repeat protein